MSFAYEEEATLTAGIDAASVVTCLAFSPRDDFLLAGLRDSFVVWTLDGTLVLQFTMGYNVESVAWTGATMALVGCQGGVIVQVNVTQRSSGRYQATCDVHYVTPDISISCLAVNNAFSRLLLAGETHCSLWTRRPPNLNAAGLAWALANTLPNPHGGEITAAQFMPNNRAAVAFRQHGILIFDLQSFQSYQLGITGNVPIGFAMISANASRLVIPNQNAGFDVYDTPTGHHYHQFVSGEPEIVGIPLPVSFIHGGECLVTGGNRETSIWHLETRQSLQTWANGCELLTCNHASNVGNEAIQRFRFAAARRGGIVVYRATHLHTRPKLTVPPCLKSLFLNIVGLALLAIVLTASGFTRYSISTSQ